MLTGSTECSKGADHDEACLEDLATFPFVSHFHTHAPQVPLKVIVGNEPDLVKERRSWSWGPEGDGDLEERKRFVVDELAPLMGKLIRRLAFNHRDVEFITPALSGEMNAAGATVPFSKNLFGGLCPVNVSLGLHGYAGDNTEGGATEQRAKKMAVGTCRVAGTEIGSTPYDSHRMVAQGLLTTGVAWIFLSEQHLAGIQQYNPHEDNAYSFSADADGDSNQSTIVDIATMTFHTP